MTKELSETIYLKAFDVNEEGLSYNYLFLLGTTSQYFETFDFERNKNSKGDISSLFGDNSTNKKFYFETSNLKNETLLSFVGYKDNQYKLIFKGFSIRYNSSTKITRYSYNSIRNVINTGMSSCLRTENEVLGCWTLTNLFKLLSKISQILSIFPFISFYIKLSKLRR